MEARKIAEALQDAEIVVLKALKKTPLSTEELQKKTSLDLSSINRASLWLQNKGLITVKEHTHFSVRLDKLGQKYASDKLPERKFLMAIDVSPKNTEDIAKLMNLDKQETLFSLGRWKKKGVVTLEDGKVKLVKKEYLNTSTSEELFLKKLASKEEIPYEELSGENQFAFDELKKRGLVTKTERKQRELSTTDFGIEVADSVTAEARIGALTSDIIKSGAWKSAAFRRYDITSPVPKLWPGKKQSYLKFLDEARDELTAMGFEEMSGPLVELSFWNNDALYMPQDHPARGIQDLYYVKSPKEGKVTEKDLLKAIKATHENGGKTGSKGWQYKFDESAATRLLLRSQTTAVSARTLANKPNIPGAYFSVDRNYRPEKLDATHLVEFNQCEGIVLGDGLTFKHLLGLLADFMKKFTGSDKFHFRPGYFPFTEPSVEGFFWHPSLKRWIEIGGAGVLRPEVTEPLGIKVPVLAWGLGIDRLFMMKENISDIRQLFSQDIQHLREAKL